MILFRRSQMERYGGFFAHSWRVVEAKGGNGASQLDIGVTGMAKTQ